MKRKGTYSGMYGVKSGHYVKDKILVRAGRFYADDGSDFHAPEALIKLEKSWFSKIFDKLRKRGEKMKSSNMAYKAVYINQDGRLSSLITSKDAEVIYQLNKWINTKKWLADRGYHLVCFDTLDNLKKSVLPYVLNKYVAIFECEMKGIITNIPPMVAFHFVYPSDFRLSSSQWPEGTIMAEQIKLIRRIET